MSLHNDALGHHGTSEWAKGTQHRSDHFSQPQIQADRLNYACKTIENCLIEKLNSKKIISNAWLLRMMLVSSSVYLQFRIVVFHGFFHITSPVRATETASRFESFTYRIMGGGMPQPPGTAVFPPVCQQAAVWTGAPAAEPSPRSVHTRTSGVIQSAEPPNLLWHQQKLRVPYPTPEHTCTCTHTRMDKANTPTLASAAV